VKRHIFETAPASAKRPRKPESRLRRNSKRGWLAICSWLTSPAEAAFMLLTPVATTVTVSKRAGS
jgi:hypothetical protein